MENSDIIEVEIIENWHKNFEIQADLCIDFGFLRHIIPVQQRFYMEDETSNK